MECLASVTVTLHSRSGYVPWPKMILPDVLHLSVALMQVRRWIARTNGSLLLALLAVGEGLPNPLALSLPEILLFVAFLDGVLSGSHASRNAI